METSTAPEWIVMVDGEVIDQERLSFAWPTEPDSAELPDDIISMVDMFEELRRHGINPRDVREMQIAWSQPYLYGQEQRGFCELVVEHYSLDQHGRRYLDHSAPQENKAAMETHRFWLCGTLRMERHAPPTQG